jgi:hypothetical protein
MESINHAQRWISAYKIQNAFREFAYRAIPRVSSSTLDKNLRDAGELRYQPANMHGIFVSKISPDLYNLVWDCVEVDPNRVKKVSWGGKSIKKENGRSSEIKTDFRDRQEKPVSIAVKLLEETIKGNILTPILSTTPISSLRDTFDILKKSQEVIKIKGSYAFCDPHSTRADHRHIRSISVCQAKIKGYAKSLRYHNPTTCKPVAYPFPPPKPYENPEDTLERKFKELEARIEALKNQTQQITPPDAPLKPKLARSCPRTIYGVPAINQEL